jgi:hypothetical protein
MTDSTHETQVRFDLDDADYWTAPDKTLFDMLDPLADANFDGVVLGAPSFVDIERRATLPLAVLRAGTDRQRCELDMGLHGSIVAVELDSNRALVSDAFDRGEVEPAEDGDGDEGYGASVDTIELRELFELPWQPSTYVIHFLLRDRRSNAVEVRLGERGYRDEVVEQLLDERRRSLRRPLEIWPLVPFHHWQGSPQGPTLPEHIGIVLTADRLVMLGPDARCRVWGAFRLPIPNRELVPEGHPLALASSPAHAVVGITLLVVAAKTGATLEFPLQIPCLEPPVRSSDDELIATGYFAVELLRLGLPSGPQTHFIYAFSRRAVAGPALMALVDPTSLP